MVKTKSAATTTVRIPAMLHRRVKVKAFKAGETVSAVVRRLLTEWVKGKV